MAQAQLPYQQQQVFRDRETNNVQVPSHELPDWSSVQCQKSLKVVLKWEILNLLQRLSDAGEEAVILTANISEDTTNVLGSQFGEKFVLQSDLALVKHQFLRYCRVHCKKKTKKTSPFSSNKRKTNGDTGVHKKQKKQSQDSVAQPEPQAHSLDGGSPLRDIYGEERDTDKTADIEASAISTLSTPIVPLSRGNSSRRKHTPKKIPSLPVAQSDSDTEDTSFNLNTIVKVEAPNEEDDDLYGEGQSNLDDYKTEYFDTFKSDDKNEYIDAFKSGNLSDDSSGGPYSSFLTGTDYQNGSGIGRELGLTSTQMARLSAGRDCDILKNSSFRGFTNNLESDSDMSGMDGLSGDALSLPDMDSSAYPSSYTSLPSTYMDPQGNMKIQLQNLDTPKKGTTRASNGFKSSFNEEPSETALLDQSKRGVRKYQCPYCDLMVRDRHDLKRHLRTHTKEKPYSCELCSKKFTRRWDQENHVKKHQEALLKEAYLAKEAEYQVKQNLDSISKMALKVKLQKQGLEKGLNLSKDKGCEEGLAGDSGLSFLRSKENGNLSSPVKYENNLPSAFR